MKNVILIACFFIGFVSTAQIKVNDLILDYKVEFEGETLKLNGAETRTNVFGDLYVGALYLKEKSEDPIAIAYSDETMAFHFEFLSNIGAKDYLYKVIKEGMEESNKGNIEPYSTRLFRLKKMYSNKLNKGDTVDFVYIKGKGILCFYNKKQLGTIEGQDFKFALFKTWLGEKPVCKTVKAGMLGKI